MTNNEYEFTKIAPEYTRVYLIANPHQSEPPILEYTKGYVYVGLKDGYRSKVRLAEFKKMIETLKDRIIEQGEDKVQAYFEVIGGYAPFYIANGDCNANNLKLVEIKKGKVIHEGKTYYYPPYRTEYSDKKTVQDGIAYCYLVMKNIGKYAEMPAIGESNTGKACKKLLELVGETMKFPCFAVRDYVNLNQTYVPKVKEIYLYPHDSQRTGVSVDYSASYRSGLDITIQLTDIVQFVKKYALPLSWGYNKPLIIMDSVFTSSLHAIADRVNAILQYSDSKYTVDDSESYGEYTLHHLRLQENHANGINEIIQKHFASYRGKKFLDTFEEMERYRNLFE
jgi:hypothetical protein